MFANIMVTTLCGKDLGTIRRRCHGRRISWNSALQIAEQVIEGLEALHDLGWLHRDIKPGNLVTINDKIIIIDFGLARRYIDTKDGSLREARKHPGFRGTY